MTPEDVLAALFGLSAGPAPKAPAPTVKTVGGFGRPTTAAPAAPRKPSTRVVGFAPAGAS